MRAAGITPVTFHELTPTGAQDFQKAITAAKNANAYGAAVEVHSADDYKSMRTFVTPDGAGGFALAGDNIVSVFKNPDSPVKGFASSALALATQLGGRRLDAFDTVLPHLYGKAGFRAVARLPFSDQHAPEGWSKELFKDHNGGKPDVVFMVYDPMHAGYAPGTGIVVTDYNQGIEAQQRALGQKPSGPAHPHEQSANIIASVPGAAAKITAARARLKTAVRTDAPVAQGGHKLPNGRYTPQREAVHNAIIKGMLTPAVLRAATPAEGQAPIAHLLGGSGGSGKSYFTGPNGTVDKSKAVYLNSDDMKSRLPEYQGWNVALMHEESSAIAKNAEAVAREHGLNVIIDGTMGSEAALRQRVADYKAAGYQVHGHFMRVTPATSAKRAVERFMRGGERGRLVDPELILKSTNAKNFESVRSTMDKWELFDNEGSKPTLVDRSK